MKILTVVGARPNFMKVAPIIAAIRRHNDRPAIEPITHVLVHTGQHYDALMSDAFFTDLQLPKPDVHLGVSSGSHASQTGEIMQKFEPVLLNEKPDMLIVVGDVNSTVACALVAAKIPSTADHQRPLIVHVEAGLRSFDRSMPEEINRILTDQLADLLFVTEETGVQNLEQEGVASDKIHLVGNTMIDSLLFFKGEADKSTILDDLGLRNAGAYALLTLHRPANVDDREAFMNILEGLEDLASEYPIVFPVHPRTRRRMMEFGLESRLANRSDLANGGEPLRPVPGIVLVDPLGYLDFLCLMKNAHLVVTDSGGIQEETTCLGVPCVTVRNNTERPVTVKTGTNIIAGTEREGIRAAIRRQTNAAHLGGVPEKWDGHAAARILDILVRTHAEQKTGRDTPVPQTCS